MEKYALNVGDVNPYANEDPRKYSKGSTMGIAGYILPSSGPRSFDTSCSGNIPLRYSVKVFDRKYKWAA